MTSVKTQRTAPRRKPPGCLPGIHATDRGQAAVEFVALLPVLVAVILAMGQGAVAGWASWSAGGAARVAARAHALGESPERAARRALPRVLAQSVRVRTSNAERTPALRVRLRIPSVVPGLRFGTVSAEAGLPRQLP